MPVADGRLQHGGAVSAAAGGQGPLLDAQQPPGGGQGAGGRGGQQGDAAAPAGLPLGEAKHLVQGGAERPQLLHRVAGEQAQLLEKREWHSQSPAGRVVADLEAQTVPAEAAGPEVGVAELPAGEGAGEARGRQSASGPQHRRGTPVPGRTRSTRSAAGSSKKERPRGTHSPLLETRPAETSGSRGGSAAPGALGMPSSSSAAAAGSSRGFPPAMARLLRGALRRPH